MSNFSRKIKKRQGIKTTVSNDFCISCKLLLMATSSIVKFPFSTCKNHRKLWYFVISQFTQQDGDNSFNSLEIFAQFLEVGSRQFRQNSACWCLYHHLQDVIRCVHTDADVQHFTISNGKFTFGSDNFSYRSFKNLYETNLRYSRTPFSIIIQFTGSKAQYLPVPDVQRIPTPCNFVDFIERIEVSEL